jgi:predicted PurR-regulated permease PerM
VFALLVVGVVTFVVALGALLVDQVAGLVDAIPGYADQITDFVSGLAAAAVGLSTTLVGLVLQGLTIGLFTFYLVADGPGCAGRSARCCRPAASGSPCGCGTWPSRAPAVTSTPGRCWPAGRPWPPPGS